MTKSPTVVQCRVWETRRKLVTPTVKRDNRSCRPIPPGHEWANMTCHCGAPATHLVTQSGIDWSVACQWHAHTYVRGA